MVGSHPHIRNTENTLIVGLTWLAGTATQTFAPGGKHPRPATRTILFTHPP